MGHLAVCTRMKGFQDYNYGFKNFKISDNCPKTVFLKFQQNRLKVKSVQGSNNAKVIKLCTKKIINEKSILLFI